MICPNCKGRKKFGDWDCWQCRGHGEAEQCGYCKTIYAHLDDRLSPHRCFQMVAEERTNNPEANFRELCMMHDLTYQYSDDPRYWQAGECERKAIVEYAKKLPRSTAVRIWNEVVETKVNSTVHKQFFWNE